MTPLKFTLLKQYSFLLITLLYALIVFSPPSEATAIEKKLWGNINQKPIYLYSVTNVNGMILKMTNYGAKITSLFVPDKNGKLDDVVLGFDSLAEYIAPNQSFGATIGRYTNRIRDGKFTIDGINYELTKNDGKNTIHGGSEFETAVWNTKIKEHEHGIALIFTYFSKDRSNGFPGNLLSTITYTLTHNNEVKIDFEATTDKTTQVNFTHHGYFNLNGMKDLIYDHTIEINANKYVVLSTDDVTATGEIDTVEGKFWDLRKPTRIGENIDKIPLGGYHQNYIFDNYDGTLKKVAKIVEPNSGRTLELSTTQPGVTFYTAMGLTHKPKGKNGIKYPPHIAFCLETQHHVGAANHPQFPSTLLKPNEKYHEVAIYKFGIE